MPNVHKDLVYLGLAHISMTIQQNYILLNFKTTDI